MTVEALSTPQTMCAFKICFACVSCRNLFCLYWLWKLVLLVLVVETCFACIGCGNLFYYADLLCGCHAVLF